MIDLKINIVGVTHWDGTATVGFAVEAFDHTTGRSTTSQIDYAPVAAAPTASNDALLLLVEASVEYGRVAQRLRAEVAAARPLPSGAAVPNAPIRISDDEQRRRWAAAVDDLVAAITGQVTRFQLEYVEREAAAQAYFDSGYTIAPTEWVTRFADAAGLTYPIATARILAQAAAYRTALRELGGCRMDKYRILRAPSLEAAKIELDEITAVAIEVQRNLT